MESEVTPDQLIDSYEKAITQDYIGLWEIVGNAKTVLKAKEAIDVQARTLDLVKRMLSRGFRPGHLAERGGFDDWPDQNPDSVLHRIEAEWNKLGHEPNINDICRFTRDESN